MSNPNSYTERYVVRVDETDRNFDMTVKGLTALFQTLAGRHCEILGISQRQLLERYDKKWFIVKEQIRVNRLPHSEEEITVTTYPLKPSTIKFPRCAFAYDKDGNELFGVYSEWCIVDKISEKPVKSSTFDYCIDEYLTDMPDVKNVNLNPFGDGDYVYTKTVRLTDLDSNNHTNNTIYSNAAYDVFSVNELKDKALKEFQINFLAQTYENDQIEIFKNKLSDTEYYVCGKIGEKYVFKAYFEFKNN